MHINIVENYCLHLEMYRILYKRNKKLTFSIILVASCVNMFKRKGLIAISLGLVILNCANYI